MRRRRTRDPMGRPRIKDGAFGLNGRLPQQKKIWRYCPWLTDKTQTLSFSGCFLVLKHKTRLATLSILLLRGHRWFRIRCATEVHRRDQLVALRESIVHPMPANLQIT